MLVVLGLGFWLASVVPLSANIAMPAKLQVALFSKIFSYDKSLKASLKDDLLLGVMFVPGDKDSESAKNEILLEFKMASEHAIANKRIIAREASSLDDIRGLDILYVTRGNDNRIDDIIVRCNEYQVLGISGSEEYAEKGLAVSLGIKAEKPVIIINRSGAKACGANFSSQLLSLAKII